MSKPETKKDKPTTTTTTTDSYHSYHHPPPPPPRFHLGEGVEQTFQYKATKIYHVDFEVARDFARFCHYLDPPLSASQGVQEAMEYYMMVRQKDLVCTAQFVVKPVMAEVKEPKRAQCEIHGCKEDAVGSGVWRGKDAFKLCEQHFQEAKDNPQEWKLCNDIAKSPLSKRDNDLSAIDCGETKPRRNDDRLEEALGHKVRTEP